jgi:hypothetical protein
LRKGETRVRFLAEIKDWQEYWEHYDETVKFFPCTGDRDSCPGCLSTVERTRKASKRYLAPVLDPKTGRVWGLKMGLELANRLSLRNDRNNGTITNRDYTLIRTGDGLDTEYDVEQEEIVAINLDVYADTIDVEQLLSSQFAAAWPDFVEPGSPNGRKATEQPPPPAPVKRARKATAPAVAPAQTGPDGGSTEDPPSEGPVAEPEPGPATADADNDDEAVEITEEDLRAMNRGELIKLARRAEIPITLTMSREAIIDLFLEQFAV